MLSVGKFAKLGCVSEATLHLYQRKGILIPSHIDENTGYRYYELNQLATLTIILQLQTADFSLKEIKEILDADSSEQFYQALEDRNDTVQRRQFELAISQRVILELMESCELVRHRPESGRILEETLQPMPVLAFEYLNEPWGEDELSWSKAVEFLKTRLKEIGLPVSLCRLIGGFAAPESLKSNEPRLSFSHVFIPVEGLEDYLDHSIETIDGGTYLISYLEYHDEDPVASFFENEAALARKMAQEAADRNLEIAGRFFSIIVVTSPMGGFVNNDCILKLFLPVKSS